MPYRIEYTPTAVEHLRRLSARDQRIIIDTVHRRLRDQPQVPARNRKPLQPNDLATWELRIRDFRVFYDVLETAETGGDEHFGELVVSILAIGVKQGSRLLVGGEEVEL